MKKTVIALSTLLLASPVFAGMTQVTDSAVATANQQADTAKEKLHQAEHEGTELKLKSQHAAEGKQESLSSKVSEGTQKTWDKTKEGAEKGWDATKEKSQQGWNATKDGAAKGWDETKEKSQQGWDATKKGAAKGWDVTKEKSQQGWDATKEGAAKGWDATKDAAGSLKKKVSE